MSDDIKNKMLLSRAKALKLHGVIARWEEISTASWVEEMIIWEENERSNRGLKRRIDDAKLGRFKLLNEFDWSWPKKCDREAIEEFMRLSFIGAATNIIFCGPNGVGKSTLACNIAHQAVLRGHTALFSTAGNMLNDLAAQDGDNALRRRINFYTKPQVLVIDEVGYLSYSNRHADLMFAVISNRYQVKPTIITTNKPFSEWNEIFPNASCVVSLIDRLVHNSEIVSVEAESFRLKEAQEQSAKRKESRSKRNIKVTTKNAEE
jgi:DNA replication protein DnaC